MASSDGASVESVNCDIPPSTGRKGKRNLVSDDDLQPTPKKTYNLRNRKPKLSEEEVATRTPLSNRRTGKRLAESDSGFEVTSKKSYYSRKKTSTLSEEEGHNMEQPPRGDADDAPGSSKHEQRASGRREGKEPVVPQQAPPEEDPFYIDLVETDDPIGSIKINLKKISKEILRLATIKPLTQQIKDRASELLHTSESLKGFLRDFEPHFHDEGAAGGSASNPMMTPPPSRTTTNLFPTAESATRSLHASTVAPSTGSATSFPGCSYVPSTGMVKDAILIVSDDEGIPLNVAKVPGNDIFWRKLGDECLRIFGPTLRTWWNLQTKKLKDDLIESMTQLFGPRAFERNKLLEKAGLCLRYIRDQYRKNLENNPRYDRPPYVPEAEWQALILDGKYKADRKDKITPVESTLRLPDTSKATKARIEKHGTHKLGSGGFSKLQARVGSEFKRCLTEEDKRIGFQLGYKAVAERLRAEISVEGSNNDASEPQPDNPSTESVDAEGSHDVHPSGGAVEDRWVDVHERVDVESRQNDVVRSEDPPLQQHRNLRPSRTTNRTTNEGGIDDDIDAPLSAYIEKRNRKKKKK